MQLRIQGTHIAYMMRWLSIFLGFYHSLLQRFPEIIMHIIAPAPYIGISWRKYSVSLNMNAEAKMTAAHIVAMAITVRLHFVPILSINIIIIFIYF